MQDLGLSAELPQFEMPPAPCMYLPDRQATMEYRSGRGISADDFEQLLSRGWRRFGSTIFRPKCATCFACRSLRVAVERFIPTKSQRRTLRRNDDVTVVVQPVNISEDHLRLFNAYHTDMQRRRGWRHEGISRQEYWWTFGEGGCSFAYEMLYYCREGLMGVGIVDLLPRSSSSVYFYHDPAWRAKGPGTYSLLREIELGRQAGRTHHYLGYWIAENQSMAYKSRFGPHELLRRHVADHQTPDWNDHGDH